VIVVATLLAGGIGAPLPEELALVGAGYCLARHASSPAMMIVAVFAAVLAGDVILYCGGRGLSWLGGVARFAPKNRARLERAFARHGARLMMPGRFVPGLRSSLLVAAGAAKMSPARLFACDAAAATIGVALWMSLGYALGPEIITARLPPDFLHALAAGGR
jgi:membrane protein DedA with SNARE-associated domain